MVHALAADAVLVVHLGFILWVALGAAAVAWRVWIAALHLPALCWGVYVSLAGRICPLTPLEQQLRRAAGEQGYSGSFIDHYLVPLIYPEALTRSGQVALGVAVIGFNLAIYAIVLYRRRRRVA